MDILRDTITRCLGLERSQVVAFSEDVGGSFGAKNHPYPEYIMAAAIRRLLKHPVRWVDGPAFDRLLRFDVRPLGSPHPLPYGVAPIETLAVPFARMATREKWSGARVGA